MRILLIHTAGGEGSVALADTGLMQPIVATEVLPGRTSSELLVPIVRQLLEVRGWNLNALGAVVVVHGPGSFTGVRVGLSAAKGFSEAAGVPLVAVSRLALLATAAVGEGEPIHAVLDAGRGEFYYGKYLGRRRLQESLMSRKELLTAVGGGVVVACEAKVAETLELALQIVAEPSAGDALPFVLERIEANDFDDVATLDANYLRRSDAEIFAKPAVRAVP
jgi:tRNA threonylcarbamoyladenosine biosynthesis protein TsaB